MQLETHRQRNFGLFSKVLTSGYLPFSCCTAPTASRLFFNPGKQHRHLTFMVSVSLVSVTRLMTSCASQILKMILHKRHIKTWFFYFYDNLANAGRHLPWCKLTHLILCVNQALIETHDDVASKNFEVVPPEAYPLITGETIIPQSLSSIPYNSAQNLTQDAVRMVGIRKNPEESLVIYFSFT